MTVINESGDSFATDAQWDAGDLGCGSRLNAMPGQVLLVTARDAGAREDIPAFCRMTGHQLLNADTASARYRIRARMPK
jgi:tRNA 2-thiouridine synthesizing protein A